MKHHFKIIATFFQIFALLIIPMETQGQASTDLNRDFGDAPASRNAFAVAMTAYPGVRAEFPTVFSATPPGPMHRNGQLDYFLGKGISDEEDADSGVDQDGFNNLAPAQDVADNDRYDDGLSLPAELPHCERIKLRYIVTVSEPVTTLRRAYVNIWADWDRSGSWNEAQPRRCDDGTPAPEWAVENHMLEFDAPGIYTLETPPFVIWNREPAKEMWLRISLSNAPAPHADGRGPVDGYSLGETEDYLLDGKLDRVPSRPAPEIEPAPFEPLAIFVPHGNSIYLPRVVNRYVPPAPGDLPLSGPQGKLIEVDVAHIGGTGSTSVQSLVVSAAGTGAAARLTSWEVNGFNGLPPQQLQDSQNIIGLDVKLQALTLGYAPGQSHSMLISGIRRNGNLWLTSWRVEADGTFVQLDTRGYGANAHVSVAAYAIAHRELRNNDNVLVDYQVVTPIRTDTNELRLISWSVDPHTGVISGEQDSGDWDGNPAADSELAATRVNGDGWTGPYYIVSYESLGGNMVNYFWQVSSSGVPTYRGSGLSGLNIRGTSTVVQPTQATAISPLTDEGFLSAVSTGPGLLRMTSWDNQSVLCGDFGCTLAPYRISDNSQDLLQTDPGVLLPLPTVVANQALLRDVLYDDDLFSKNPTNNPQGIASVTKVMTLIITLQALEAGTVDLDDPVVISGTIAGTPGSTMGLEFNEVQSLRNLLYGLIIVSGNDAALAIAEHVAGSEENFADLMNAEATSLGMSDSTYCRPHGGCFSTPEDQITLWASVYTDPMFQQFAGADSYDACGVDANGEEICHFLERMPKEDVYPGMDSRKTGSKGFFCSTNDYPQTSGLSLCASRGCYTAQVTRLNRTLLLNLLHPLSSTAPAPSTSSDALNLLDYGYMQLFTPDFRGLQSSTAGGVTDFGLDYITDTKAVTAVVNNDNDVRLCKWNISASSGDIDLDACSQHPVDNLAAGVQAPAPTILDLVRISELEAEGDYLLGHMHNNSLMLRLWRVAEKDF